MTERRYSEEEVAAIFERGGHRQRRRGVGGGRWPHDRRRGAVHRYEDDEVVVDGNLVTSRWPMDLPAFVREMMKMIRK